MDRKTITCSMCGHTFTPAGGGACQSCPLNSGCTLVCCPNCGYENVDVQQSALARLAVRWFHRPTLPRQLQPAAPSNRLSDVPPGRRTRVIDFLPGLSNDRRAQLQAYGLEPGYYVQVKQHSPVTIIQVDQTELALENDLARQVQVGD